MIHPNTQIQYINDIIGYGVFATVFIPQGTITWVRDNLDKELTCQEMSELHPLVYQTALTYSYRNNKGNYILPWDHTRYVNHSFFANTMLTPYGFEIAIANIMPGEQITNDYGTLNIIESFEPFDEGGDRKMVHPSDLETFYPAWDLRVNESIRFLRMVNQPLGELLSIDKWCEMDSILAGIQQPVSMLKLLYRS